MDRAREKIGRNQPCPCGSGKKYKKCCLGKAHLNDDADPSVTPSLDGVDVLVRQGYILARNGDSIRACDRWFEAWLFMRARLRPEMLTCSTADVAFSSCVPLAVWLSDFVGELQLVAFNRPRQAELGVELCTQVLAQFSSETPTFILDFRADLGEFHALAGRNLIAEQMFLDIVRDRPDSAVGYVRLAELLERPATEDDDPHARLERACALLERALAVPVTDAADYDVERRLAYLRDSKPATA